VGRFAVPVKYYIDFWQLKVKEKKFYFVFAVFCGKNARKKLLKNLLDILEMRLLYYLINTVIQSRAEPSRAEPSRAEPSRATDFNFLPQ
jgi:hypothetical protein